MIMQFLRWKGRKVHYSAVFGDGKKRGKALNAEFAETLRKVLRREERRKTRSQERRSPDPSNGAPYDFF
jgi:hypothetical protein